MSYQPFLDQKWASYEGPDIYMYMIIRSNIYDITSIYQSAYFKFLRPTERGSLPNQERPKRPCGSKILKFGI